MNVELISLIKNEAKLTSSSAKSSQQRSVASDLRAKRQSRLIHKQLRTRRQIDTSTRSADSTESTDKPSVGKTLPSRISVGESEWSGATGGPPAEVVLRLHPAPTTTARANFSIADTDGGGVVVRAEEALIVAFVLLLWVAAIALFFNRWGKIRMLEPYQPKFQQQHRQSCALAESAVAVPPHHRPSLARGCMSYDYGVGYSAYQPCGYMAHRPRQNSVFVSSMALIPESPPRRSRSAADLPGLSTTPSLSTATRASRAASLHSAVDIRVVPSPKPTRKPSLMDEIQVHVRGSVPNVNRPKSPRRLTITNV